MDSKIKIDSVTAFSQLGEVCINGSPKQLRSAMKVVAQSQTVGCKFLCHGCNEELPDGNVGDLCAVCYDITVLEKN